MIYEDDHFHPTNVEPLDTDQKKLLDKINSRNNHYLSYYIEIPKQERQRDASGRFKKYRKVELYGSGDVGSRIRNAVTGDLTNHIVGTTDEHEYWSVLDSRGMNGRQEPLVLFYDSPEQYERHMKIQVPQHVKEEWLNRITKKHSLEQKSNVKNMLSSLRRTSSKPISESNLTLPWEKGWTQ